MSKLRNIKLVFIIILCSTIAFGAGYLVNSTNVSTSKEVVAHLETEGEHDLEEHIDKAGNITWTCSMHPQIQLPEPGKCPICFMELIPLERRDEGEQTSLREDRKSVV